MPKVVKRPVAVPALDPAPVRSTFRADKTAFMKDYAKQHRARGNAQVKVWLPEHMVEWLHHIARQARAMHDAGRDPLPQLPPSLRMDQG